MKDQKKAYLYAGLTVLLWSTVDSAFKISLRYLNFVELLSIASFISTLCLFIILLSKNKIHLLKTIKKRDFFYSSLLGALNPFLYYLIVFKAYELLPAQQAQPLNLTWGIVIVLLSAPILKQKTTRCLSIPICQRIFFAQSIDLILVDKLEFNKYI